MRTTQTALLLALGIGAAASAQTITPGALACLPNGENGVITARIEPAPGAEVQVRLYFRRMSLEVEDFYFTPMVATGGGSYWGVFPQPESQSFSEKKYKNAQKQETAWAEWWRTKEGSENRDPNPDLDDSVIKERASAGKLVKRDWMANQTDDALQEFLKTAKTEPTEYFIGLYDPSGKLLARSPQQVVEVRDNCNVALTPQQAGMAQNLTVGETASWQDGESVFHWECTGIVTRIDTENVMRADQGCRACIIAWWPIAAAGSVSSLTVVTEADPRGGPPSITPTSGPPPPPEVSPSRP